MEREAQHSSNAQKQDSGPPHEEPPPIPPVKGGQEHDAVLVAPNDGSVKPDNAKGVAGRKKYKGGEHWDVASGKQAPIGGKKKADAEGEAKEEDKKEEKTETDEEHKVEVELNSILKKGPSKSKHSSIR